MKPKIVTHTDLVTFLWTQLRERCPDMFDAGGEHGPWLYGDTRQDHGPFPWMRDAWSYYIHIAMMGTTRKLVEDMYGPTVLADQTMRGLREWVK